jgi:hypothetical protein
LILPILVTATTVLFFIADLLRGSRPREATIAALCGWVLLGAATLVWARGDQPWRLFWRTIGRTAVLALVAAAVLLVYLQHSHVLEAGTHVDAVQTWIGLEWVLTLDNPITLVGRTPSYAQFPSCCSRMSPRWSLASTAWAPSPSISACSSRRAH